MSESEEKEEVVWVKGQESGWKDKSLISRANEGSLRWNEGRGKEEL